MAEFTSPQEGALEGYRPNTEHAALELHRLLAIFLASPSFAKLRKGNGERWEAIDHLQQFEDDEITRILLSAAVTARVVDDRERGVFELVAGPCGILVETKDGETTEIPLTLREACNKIIHAKKIRFDVGETEERQPYITQQYICTGLAPTDWNGKRPSTLLSSQKNMCLLSVGSSE